MAKSPKAPLIFKLKSTSQISCPSSKKEVKEETAYCYEGPNGEIVSFHPHPTKAFVCAVLAETNADMKIVRRVLEAAVGSWGPVEGTTFEERIQTLKA